MMKKTLLLLLCSASLWAAVKTITMTDLEQLMGKEPGLVIVDARNTEYYSGEMIPGAIWLPYDASESRITSMLPSKSAPLVLYCFSASCPFADRLATRLEKLGYSNLSIYTNGLKEWKNSGHSTIQ